MNNDNVTTKPFPSSEKVFVKGEIHPIKVAMREIFLSPTDNCHKPDGTLEQNPPVTVYDTSGPYTDSSVQIDIEQGIERLREEWILGRGDVEQLEDFSAEYYHERMS